MNIVVTMSSVIIQSKHLNIKYSSQRIKKTLLDGSCGVEREIREENLISLYNALEDKNYPLDTEVKINMLDEVFFKKHRLKI